MLLGSRVNRLQPPGDDSRVKCFSKRVHREGSAMREQPSATALLHRSDGELLQSTQGSQLHGYRSPRDKSLEMNSNEFSLFKKQKRQIETSEAQKKNLRDVLQHGSYSNACGANFMNIGIDYKRHSYCYRTTSHPPLHTKPMRHKWRRESERLSEAASNRVLIHSMSRSPPSQGIHCKTDTSNHVGQLFRRYHLPKVPRQQFLFSSSSS